MPEPETDQQRAARLIWAIPPDCSDDEYATLYELAYGTKLADDKARWAVEKAEEQAETRAFLAELRARKATTDA
jgi:hypothetical protein